MKHLLSILLLLVWVPGAALGQNPLDSLFFVEKEDYMSTLSIKPVEDPLGLLMRVLERLEKDMQQKHSRREYQLEAPYHQMITNEFRRVYNYGKGKIKDTTIRKNYMRDVYMKYPLPR